MSKKYDFLVRPFTPVFRFPRDSTPHPTTLDHRDGARQIKPTPRFQPYLENFSTWDWENKPKSGTGVRKIR